MSNVNSKLDPTFEAIGMSAEEALAVAAGLPESSALVGRHVHIGGVKAYKLCCKGVEAL